MSDTHLHEYLFHQYLCDRSDQQRELLQHLQKMCAGGFGYQMVKFVPNDGFPAPQKAFHMHKSLKL